MGEKQGVEGAPEKKMYNLKPVESAMIGVLVETHQAQMSNFLSLLGVERFAYSMTPRTKFNLSVDLKTVEIWDEPEPENKANVGSPPEIPGASSNSIANAVKE